MRRLALLAFAAILSAPAFAQSATTPASHCASLTSLALGHAKITAASLTTPATAIPGVKIPAALIAHLPAFCRVTIEDHPSPDSDIQTEVWLPVTGWNGKYRGQGNGGFAGLISYDRLAAAILEGYTTAGTDTGHVGALGNFALGHPEKVKDFGWRAIHDMTLEAKQITAAFYGKAPAHSYFSSCSDGGREALMEAQRFPTDYDGIVAGAPAYNWTALISTAALGGKLLHASATSNIPASKLPAIASAVRAACDAKDGVTDGILNDPTQCHFDPAVLTCKQGDADTCLLPEQVAVLKSFYAPKLDEHGNKVYAGMLPGAEDAPGAWNSWIIGDKSSMLFYSTGYFTNFVYEQPDWKLASFEFPRDYKLATVKTGAALNATDPNLTPFLSRGGRLILYHGWADPGIPPLGTIDYYNAVAFTVGQKLTQDSVRLYMVPGMLHCGGGPGATIFGENEAGPRSDAQHDVFTALEQWVEDDKAPGTLIATKFNDNDPAKPVAMTRPLCVYPAESKYTGGDSNDAKSFVCTAPQR